MNIKISNGKLLIDNAPVSCKVGDVFSAGGLYLPQVSAYGPEWPEGHPHESAKLPESLVDLMAAAEQTTRRMAGKVARREIRSAFTLLDMRLDYHRLKWEAETGSKGILTDIMESLRVTIQSLREESKP